MKIFTRPTSLMPVCLWRRICVCAGQMPRSFKISFFLLAYYFFSAASLSKKMGRDSLAAELASALMKDGNDTCTEVEGGKLLIYGNAETNSTYPSPFVSLNHIIMNPPEPAVAHEMKTHDGINVNLSSYQYPAAVCEFDTPIHFPHFVQAILRCFSYWNSRRHQAPVLLMRRPRFRPITDPVEAAKRWPFNAGILEGLRRGINLTVVMNHPDARVGIVGFMEAQNPIAPPFALHSPEEATFLHNLYVNASVDNDNEEQKQPGQRAHSHERHHSRPPPPLRIAILDRKATRKMLNPNVVHHTLKLAFPKDRVVLKYLEGTTFQEQVTFFSTQDVIISPHGAQLTGTMFMSPCSVIMEMFPCHYWIPGYFSSLANLTGVIHGHWYICNEEPPKGFASLKSRLENTKNNMCPAVGKVVVATKQLLERRRQCMDQISSV